MKVLSISIFLIFLGHGLWAAESNECNPGICAQFGNSYPGCPCQSDPTKPSTTYVPPVQQGGWNSGGNTTVSGDPNDPRNLPSANRDLPGDSDPMNPNGNRKSGDNSKDGDKQNRPKNVGGSNSGNGDNGGLNQMLPALMAAPAIMNALGDNSGKKKDNNQAPPPAAPPAGNNEQNGDNNSAKNGTSDVPPGDKSKCGKITFHCVSGGAYGEMSGMRFTISCGTATRSATGTISENTKCVGSAFPCMAGKPCIRMNPPPGSAGVVIHMPNCGSGGEPNGGLSGAGCINVNPQWMGQIGTCVGSPYEAIVPGNASSGRGRNDQRANPKRGR